MGASVKTKRVERKATLWDDCCAPTFIFWRRSMSFNSTAMIHQLRTDFEQLLMLVTGPDAHTATVSQMERSLFRQVLRLGFKLLQLFLITRVAAESHTAQLNPDQTRVPYHSQKPRDYFSIFGKLTFARAYFYTPGQAGVSPLAGCGLEFADPLLLGFVDGKCGTVGG
jgi:hypothetical protein